MPEQEPSIQPAVVRRMREVLEILATAAVIVLCSVLTWSVLGAKHVPAGPTGGHVVPKAEPALPSEPLSLKGAAVRGSPTASVAIIEYTDFQCPFCGVFARTILPTIEQTYVDTGKAVLAVKEFPLEAIHPMALRAAESAECAGAQGRFWEMHDDAFMNQRALDDSSLHSWAAALGLNLGVFSRCLEADGLTAVRADELEGQKLGVSGTPTFFVGSLKPDGRVRVTGRLTGAQPLTAFAKVVDPLLASSGHSDK